MLNGRLSIEPSDEREVRRITWGLASAMAQIMESIEIRVSRDGRRIEAKIARME